MAVAQGSAGVTQSPAMVHNPGATLTYRGESVARPKQASSIPDTTRRRLWAALWFALAAGPAGAGGLPEPVVAESGPLTLRLVPRTPEQVAAFYEARGFPAPAVEAIKSTCFVTVGVHNRGPGILWLDLERWRFLAPGGEVLRLGRNYWNAQWQRLDLPQANRSTFRWTLLPESLDLRPDEAEGGNITFAPIQEPFTIEATFASGADRQGDPLTVRLEELRCTRGDGR